MGFVGHRGQGLPALPQERGFVVGIQSVGLGRNGESHQMLPWIRESSRSFQAEGVVTGGSFVGPHNFCLQATEGVRTVIIKEAVGFAPRA